MKVSIPRADFIPETETYHNTYIGAVPHPQDFGIGKYGHKLPPPFYPSTYNVISPSSPLPQLDTSQGQAKDSSVNNQTEHQSEHCASTWSPGLDSNPTPPTDDLQSAQESFYQGYGHLSLGSPRHQPTPPADKAPSLPEGSSENCVQTLPNSYNTLHNLSLDSSSPLQCAFYQGYTYGNLQPVFSPLTGSSSPQHSSTGTGHDFDLPTGDERQSCSHASDQIEGELASVPGSAPLSIITHDTVVRNRNSPYGSAHVDDSAGLSGINSEFSFRHQASSRSSLGLETDLQQHNELENHSKKFSAVRPIKYEAWRSSILESLDETLNVSVNQFSLNDHLLQQFDRGSFSDCRLELSHEKNKFETTEFLLHSVVITQSSLLESLINATTVQEDGARHLQIQIHDRFTTPMAFEAALRVCYGESPLLFNGASYDDFKSTAEVSISWMENALAFAKTGSLLGLDIITYRGLQIASKILNWENVETALSFLLGGGLDTDWSPENHIQNANVISSPYGSDDHKIEKTENAANDCVPASTESNAEPMSDNSRNIHSPSMIDLLYQCLHFIIVEFPEDWDLDVSSRPSPDIDRLPAIPETRFPISKSRLSLIQFGDLPSERVAKASDENVVLSGIMLSLPFVFINYILDQLNEPTKDKWLRKLVKERERRRHRVLKSDSIPLDAKQAALEHGHARWEEYVELNQNSRLSIKRKLTGLEATR